MLVLLYSGSVGFLPDSGWDKQVHERMLPHTETGYQRERQPRETDRSRCRGWAHRARGVRVHLLCPVMIVVKAPRPAFPDKRIISH